MEKSLLLSPHRGSSTHFSEQSGACSSHVQHLALLKAPIAQISRGKTSILLWKPSSYCSLPQFCQGIAWPFCWCSLSSWCWPSCGRCPLCCPCAAGSAARSLQTGPSRCGAEQLRSRWTCSQTQQHRPGPLHGKTKRKMSGDGCFLFIYTARKTKQKLALSKGSAFNAMKELYCKIGKPKFALTVLPPHSSCFCCGMVRNLIWSMELNTWQQSPSARLSLYCLKAKADLGEALGSKPAARYGTVWGTERNGVYSESCWAILHLCPAVTSEFSTPTEMDLIQATRSSHWTHR